jgi:hypothetical protein
MDANVRQINQIHLLFIIILFTGLFACSAPSVLHSHLQVPSIVPISTQTAGIPTSTSPFITPGSIQVEQWKEYQKVLAKNFLSDLPAEEVICE